MFWAGLAVTIMAGLTIGTGFTMIVFGLYATFYRISASRSPRPEAQGLAPAAPAISV